jgi:hypothetical protein
MELDQVPYNRQPEPEAPVCSCARDIGLPKSLEYIGQEIFTDPLACISHNDLNPGIDTS